jgi:Fe-S-cluster containining protein
VVTEKDLERLQRSIPSINRLTKTVAKEQDSVRVLVSKPNGECILFLRQGREKGVCSEYELRPDVCRTYPIQLVRKDARLKVSLLPCMGLSRNRGRVINERFIEKHLKFATVA